MGQCPPPLARQKTYPAPSAAPRSILLVAPARIRKELPPRAVPRFAVSAGMSAIASFEVHIHHFLDLPSPPAR